MSHELRTPLNSILGFADVMLEELDGPLTENMDNDLGLIQKNGQHLLHLINDVLDMAKIESGQHEPEPREVQPARAARRSNQHHVHAGQREEPGALHRRLTRTTKWRSMPTIPACAR
ncbi:MAG: hypothetical protein MZV64_60255 [Ignavibacteriales bacterium]|nr:hypothetical protein [Ignavibacteriales bacterium]